MAMRHQPFANACREPPQLRLPEAWSFRWFLLPRRQVAGIHSHQGAFEWRL
jgi:hypothetical protein